MTRKTVSSGDVKLALALPVYAALSWVMPQRLWPVVCQFAARVYEALGTPNPLIAKVEAVLPADLAAVGSAAIVRELEAGRREHYMQVFSAYRPGGWRPKVEIVGLNHLVEAREARRGVVLWIDHFVFNGLLPKQALAQAGFAYTHLSRPEHGFSKTRFGIRFLNPLRSRIEDANLKGRVVIARGAEERAVRRLMQLLKSGEVVSVTAGAWEGRSIAYAELFGSDYPLATGAPSMAYATKSALIAVAVYRCLQSGAFKVVLSPLTGMETCATRADGIAQALRSYGQHLEPIIRTCPGQWRGWGYLARRETRGGA